MRFLWSGGQKEISDKFAGVLTTPAHRQLPTSIAAGAKWAADNQAFTRGFDPALFFDWLNGRMIPYRARCLFVAVPDAVGDARKTIELFNQWYPAFGGWPLAFVAQDGQEDISLPNETLWNTLFIGGSTAWKESAAAIETIKRAQAMGKHIHIGRVNWKRRYQLFTQIQGSEDFTCDGTRQRFDGSEKTTLAWLDYQNIQTLKIW